VIQSSSDRLAHASKSSPTAYELGMLCLSIYVIVELLVEYTVELNPEILRLLALIDYGVCAVFFVDFLHCLLTAKSKSGYLKSGGWFDFISSIPLYDFFQAGRLARIVRIIRILRAYRSMKRVLALTLRNRANTAAQSAIFLGIGVLIFGSVTILHVEDTASSNIKTAEDALWWCCTTITTVGYGDKYPVTSEGRIVGVIVMIVGVGMFGTFTAWVGSWMLRGGSEQKGEGLAADLQRENSELRQENERLRAGSSTRL
jgi:voltage-gated potassium channel